MLSLFTTLSRDFLILNKKTLKLFNFNDNIRYCMAFQSTTEQMEFILTCEHFCFELL